MGRRFSGVLAASILGLTSFSIALAAPSGAPAAAASSQQAPIAHVTVSGKLDDDYTAVTATLAVSPKTLRDEKIWQAQQKAPPSGAAVVGWLIHRGGKLDSQDGPALIYHYTNGATTYRYIHDGQRDRQDGPAIIERSANGTVTREEYYHNDQRDRQSGPAITWRNADGSTYEEYWRNGHERDRQDGPVAIKRNAKGEITFEVFYENGYFKTEYPGLPSATPPVARTLAQFYHQFTPTPHP